MKIQKKFNRHIEDNINKIITKQEEVKEKKKFMNILVVVLFGIILSIAIILGTQDNKDKKALKMYQKCVKEASNSNDIHYCDLELEGFYLK